MESKVVGNLAYKFFCVHHQKYCFILCNASHEGNRHSEEGISFPVDANVWLTGAAATRGYPSSARHSTRRLCLSGRTMWMRRQRRWRSLCRTQIHLTLV